jgi:nuclear pore complex protein Nup93
MTNSSQLTVQLKDCWMLLASIVGESGSGNSNPFSEPQEREFVKDYILNSAVDSPEAARVRRRVEKGSRKFLETQYGYFICYPCSVCLILLLDSVKL